MRDWTIKSIPNPHPVKWPGRWFSFAEGDNEAGTAHESTLHLYVGAEQAEAALSKVLCDGCGWKGSEEDTNDIDKCSERVSPGGIMPAGECPKCGALAFPEGCLVEG